MAATIVQRKPQRKPSTFLFNGGYQDRLLELSPQQWDNVDYRAGYVQAILDLAKLDDYQPVDY